MMYCLNTLLALVFCLLMTNSSAQAEQIGTDAPKVPSAIQRGPSTPLNTAPTPLQIPLVLGQLPQFPSLCSMIPKIVDAILQKNTEAYEALKAAGAGGILSVPSTIKSYYVAGIRHNCCSAEISFSIQEQQAAGCVGSDTVQACMDKLTKQCIRNQAQALHMRENVQKSRDAIKILSEKTAQLSQEMQNLLTIMP